MLASFQATLLLMKCWPGGIGGKVCTTMSLSFAEVVSHVLRTRALGKAPLTPSPVGGPFRSVGVNIMDLPLTVNGSRYVITSSTI